MNEFLNSVVTLFLSLGGFAALVSMLVNVGKWFGIVKDGSAEAWIKMINLAGLVAVGVVMVFFPDFDFLGLDAILGSLAALLGLLFPLFLPGMNLVSKFTYEFVKYTPLIGKSFSGRGMSG